MKQLKDYLHFYLGAECIFDRPYHAEYNLDGIVTPQIIMAANQDRISGGIENIRLKLFRLSSISEIQKSGIGAIKDNIGWVDVTVNSQNQSYRITPNRVAYLLSKHFDLFGLIESGLAIDKTLLTLPV